MNGKRWTDADTATLQRLSALGRTDAEIARETGHCRRTIQRQRSDRGINSSYEILRDLGMSRAKKPWKVKVPTPPNRGN